MPRLRHLFAPASQPCLEMEPKKADHSHMRTVTIAFLSMLPMLSWTACAQDPDAGSQKPAAEESDAAKAGRGQEPGDGQTQVPSDFVRYVQVGDGGHLDTAITTYEKDGVKVIFYGAVHIADAKVYQELNDRFTTCDVLLYELVGPEDYRPTKDREQTGFNPVSMLQQGMKSSLEMAFQLDEVDYQVDNFVHADMTPQEFQSSMTERGESLMSIMFNMMMDGAKMQREQAEAAGDDAKPAPKFDLVKAFQSGEGRHLMRVTFASQLEQMEMLAAGGKGSTLLEGRNEKCLKVLNREIGKGHKRLGIYYGAAHLPHMEQRLVEDMGFKKVAHEWLVAWDCKKRPDPKLDRALIKKRRKCKKQLLVLARVGRDHRRADGPSEVPTPRELAELVRNGEKVYTGPLVDPWGSDFRLEKRKRGRRWQAVSLGPDKLAGTDDDIVIAEPRSGS